MIVGNQQREAEVAEHSFNGAFPDLILLTNLQQFTGKRHLIFRDIQCLTERAAHGYLFFVDIAHAGFQPLDLRCQLLVLMAPLGKEHTRLIEIVLNPGFSFSRGLVYGCVPGTLKMKLLSIRCRKLPKLACKFPISGCFLIPPFKIILFLANLGGDTLNPVATVFGDGSTQFTITPMLGAAVTFKLFYDDMVAAQLFIKRGMAFFQQCKLEGSEPGAQSIARGPQRFRCSRQSLVIVAISHQRPKHLYLPLGFEDSFVCAVEIFEMLDQGVNAWLNIEGLEHVASYEIGQVSHRLERDGLMEQIQRLLIVNAEAPTEPGAVRWKGFKQIDSRPAQTPAQCCYFGTKG